MLSVKEVGRLLGGGGHQVPRRARRRVRRRAARVEVAHLKVGDVDSTRMLIRIEEGKGRKDRDAMLSPQLVELIRLWRRAGKRSGVMLPHGWLFPERSSPPPTY